MVLFLNNLRAHFESTDVISLVEVLTPVVNVRDCLRVRVVRQDMFPIEIDCDSSILKSFHTAAIDSFWELFELRTLQKSFFHVFTRIAEGCIRFFN